MNKVVLHTELSYNKVFFISYSLDKKRLFLPIPASLSACREVYCDWTKKKIQLALWNKLDLPQTPVIVFYKNAFIDEHKICLRLRNTIRNIEAPLPITYPFEAKSISDKVMLREGVKGRYLFTSMLADNYWANSPVLFSLLLLFIKIIYKNEAFIPLDGVDLDTLLFLADRAEATGQERLALKYIKMYNKSVFDYIQENISDNVLINYSKAFGYGFNEFMKERH